MDKKILTIGLVLLFIFSSVAPISLGVNINISRQTLSRKIITVDDEPGDADYTSIKEAVNQSNPGDVIEVYSGTYNEQNIIINKTGITLKGISHEMGDGNDTGKPFIKGNGLSNIIEVVTNNVTITRFHMESIETGGKAIIYITNGKKSYGCIISDNDLSHGVDIIICESINCKIINNNISNGGDAIFLYRCNFTIISGNKISGFERGIVLWGLNASNITKNRINYCKMGMEISGYYNIIRYNIFENNRIGAEVGGGMSRIEKNNFFNNNRHATFSWFGGLWIGNYWNRSRLLPYPIIGTLINWYITIFWVQFDWFPAKEPYDIGV